MIIYSLKKKNYKKSLHIIFFSILSLEIFTFITHSLLTVILYKLDKKVCFLSFRFNDDEKEEPRDHSTTHINESERVKDTGKNNGEKKLKVVKLKEENQIEVDRSLEDVPKKYDNVKTVQKRFVKSENNQTKLQSSYSYMVIMV